jgi:lysophospholipase L1-like esterase
VYLALGASDATGVGAIPLSEGYVYLIQRDLDRRIPGVLLLNLGVPGARTAVVMEQARLARQGGITADLVTLWTGANDLIGGEDPQHFRDELRALVSLVKEDLSDTVILATLPDLTQLPRFRERPSPSVTQERLARFNRVIVQEAWRADAKLVDLFASPVRGELIFGPDGFHPNNAGHREIARQFLHAILPGLRVG